MSHVLAAACYARGCGWAVLWGWLWHRLHWLAVPAFAAIVAAAGLARALRGR